MCGSMKVTVRASYVLGLWLWLGCHIQNIPITVGCRKMQMLLRMHIRFLPYPDGGVGRGGKGAWLYTLSQC